MKKYSENRIVSKMVSRVCQKYIFEVHGLFDVDSGNYCPIGSVAVVQCPIGAWGSTTGLTNATCSGQCTAGI